MKLNFLFPAAFCLAAPFLLSGSNPAHSQPPQPVGPKGNFQLVLNEDFDGPGLDPKVWNSGLWFPGSINKEQQFYRAQNIEVKGGKLVISARKETVPTGWSGADQPKTLPYTSGLIQTRDKFEQTYGAFEARLKLPKGKGFFPAFWLKSRPLPGGSPPPPEIDVVENLGHEPRLYHSYHHIKNGKGANSPGNWLGEDFSSDFHTFSAVWTPNSIRWFVDGIERRPAFADTSAIWDKPMFVLLNLAIGSGWSGLPNEATRFPQTLEADYVRVWKFAPDAPELRPIAQPVAANAGPDAANAGPVAANAGPDAANAGPDAANAGPDAPVAQLNGAKPWTQQLSLDNLKSPRVISVDGQPFVPNGIYLGGEKCWADDGTPGRIAKGACTPSASGSPAMWDLDRVAQAGFNTVLSYSNGAKGGATTWSQHTASVRTFLDRADERGLKVIFSLKDLYRNKDGGWFLSNDTLQKTLDLYATSPDWKGPNAPTPLDVARGLVREFKNHRALLAWNINDELSTAYKPELEQMYALIKGEDKDNPVMQLIYRLHDPSPLYDPREYVSSTDILAADPYPVGLGRPFTFDTVSDWTRKLVAAVDGKKAVWMVPQAYARNFDPPPNMSELAPTLAEKRNMAYQMLVNRASGLIYWSLAVMQTEPAPVYNGDGSVARHPTELATNFRGQVTKDQYGETVNRVLYEPLKNLDGTPQLRPNGRPIYPSNFGRRWPEMKLVAAEVKALQSVIARGEDVALPSAVLPATLQRRALKLDGELWVLVVNTDHRNPAQVLWPLPVGNGVGRKVDASSTLGGAKLSADGKTLSLSVAPLGSGFVRVSGF